jgi:hypothetical protein
MRSIGDWIRLRVVSFRSFRGLGVGFFVGCAWVGSMLRLLLLVYSMCTRGTLRCFLIKFALTYQKESYPQSPHTSPHHRRHILIATQSPIQGHGRGKKGKENLHPSHPRNHLPDPTPPAPKTNQNQPATSEIEPILAT